MRGWGGGGEEVVVGESEEGRSGGEKESEGREGEGEVGMQEEGVYLRGGVGRRGGDNTLQGQRGGTVER